MSADFARAREQDPFKQAEKVTPKATPALPRMEENGQAPIKKGIENTVEHGSYQCLMTPTGLEEGMYSQAKTHSPIESDAKSDAIYADLIEILTRWPTLPPQVREQVLSLVHCNKIQQVDF